jgi:hypothetical protein
LLTVELKRWPTSRTQSPTQRVMPWHNTRTTLFGATRKMNGREVHTDGDRRKAKSHVAPEDGGDSLECGK